MTVYALAQLRFTDRAAYDRYRRGFLSTLEPYGGRLLAADEAPFVIEGEWDFEKVVLIAFDGEPDFRGWIESPAYRSIAVDRHAGAWGPVLLVRGL